MMRLAMQDPLLKSPNNPKVYLPQTPKEAATTDISYWLDNDGELHRDDGPALILPADPDFPIEETWWVIHGKVHREDGPAITDQHGYFWCRDNYYHRDGGPAVELYQGGKAWYRHGQYHREDGPALYNADYWSWYLENVLYSFEEWLERIEKIHGGGYAMKMKLKWTTIWTKFITP